MSDAARGGSYAVRYVRPSKVDRSSPDPRDDPGAVSVEVYASVADDGHGELWRGLRYLGLAAVVLAAVVVLLVSGLSSSGGHSQPATPPRLSSKLSPGARNLLLLVSHPYLPHDVKQLLKHDLCASSRSGAFERGVETEYARAVLGASGESLPGRAQLQATRYPRC